MKIIDAHAHMVSKGIFERMKERRASLKGKFRRQKRVKEDFSKTVKQNTAAWKKAAEENCLEKIVFMATMPFERDFLEFIKSSKKFVGIATLNPLLENAKETLETETGSGFKGIKLYPVSGAFRLNDKKAEWLYEFAARKKLPIVIHSGVTLGYYSDLNFGNPLEIDSVARGFPEVKFVFAHFGTTFFRETLMLAYSRENVLVDTSGRNGWINFLPYKFSLKEVFEKSLEIFGSGRILFGTDTRIFPEGYRKGVLEEQLGIVKGLGLNDSEISKIFYSNAKRIFKI
ncbi:MAG: amidohydrolase family protein [Candidatus ainarchaeum sp.]|nr:amidohydrolase family protein [Candidatus ainarchaeum sp.]